MKTNSPGSSESESKSPSFNFPEILVRHCPNDDTGPEVGVSSTYFEVVSNRRHLERA